MAEERRQMEVTAAEQQAVERLRMTPEQRQAEAETRRQERMPAIPPEVRQAQEALAARIDAMTPVQRRAYLAGQRLAGIARAMKRDAQRGLPVADVLAALEASEAQELDWLAGELAKTKEK